MAKHTIRIGFAGRYREVEVTTPDDEPRPWDADSKLAVVGARAPRLEGREKVTGKAKYTADVKLPGLLVARVLRSPYARAAVRSIDLSKARALPGVRAALELQNQVNYFGQPVAAVAAETEAIAEDALRLVAVQWQPQEHAVTEEDASKKDAPPVMGGRNPNVRRGDPQGASEDDCRAALEKAYATVDVTLTTPVVTHSCLESHGSVAAWDKDGGLTVWDSTQSIFGVRDGLARALQLPADKVRVIKEHMGGGFGSKLGMGQHSVIAARLAKEAGAPVKLLLTRREEHLSGGNRPSSTQRLRLGADEKGKLTVMWLESSGTPGVAGGGAQCSGPFSGVYQCPLKRVEHADVATNAGQAMAFRAPGHVQGMFALESAMDELAAKLKMDPIEFRKKNDPNDLRAAEYGEGARIIGWERRGRMPESAGPGKARGLGCAASVWGGGGGPGAQVRVVVSRDGGVEVQCGTQDIGTGTRTILAQVVGEELGLEPGAIRVRLGDTELPYSHGSGGSMTAPSVTPPARAAAARARERVLESVKAGVKDWELKGGRVTSKKAKLDLSWAEACGKMSGANVSEQATRSQNGPGYRDGTSGCQFAEVEVDLETGKVQVLRIVAVHDCGRVVNPMLVESQINGGVIQGLSYALLERRVVDRESGRVMSVNFSDYKIAGAKEIPDIKVVLFDVSNGRTNTGVMGIGEPPIVPTAGAIANAVAHAIGRRVTDLPITPDKVLAALGKK